MNPLESGAVLTPRSESAPDKTIRGDVDGPAGAAEELAGSDCEQGSVA